MFKKLIETPNGVVFITGPTGSGKTTTLYSALMHLNKPEINIVTIEDPIEYTLPGANQIQVNMAIDLNFAKILRSVLRQDPDVILVGEVRDLETARIASQAALTGHLVMTTMHTNNSLQAVTRLMEIGVEPFLVAPAVIGVLAQRLVRRICPECIEKYRPSDEEMNKYFIWDQKIEVSFYRGRGCNYCSFSGYAGRLAIHELFILNSELRNLVAKNASILEIQTCAIRNGFQTLRYDGLKKVLRGLTTISEVNRMVGEEEV
jgi:type IV pilus assembly protein PilB